MASRISNIPSLKSFMQQSQARALYRKALRISRPLDPVQRDEIRQTVRYEFDQYRSIQDVDHIAYLLTTGKRRVDQLQMSIAMARHTPQ